MIGIRCSELAFAVAVYYALRDYSLENLVGFVIGSQEPWIEVQALRSGAKEVTRFETL